MSYNALLTAENLESLQLQTSETKKLLASQIPGLMDVPDMIPSLLPSNYELGGNINFLPTPDADSLVSSPSVSNPDDELDLFGLQPSLQEQEQLLNGIPVSTPSTEINPSGYENALMNLITANQLQANLPICDPLINNNEENLLLNYSGMLPMKNQTPVLGSYDLNNIGLNEIPLNALNDLLNQQNNIEIPSLIPSTVEQTVGTEMIDPLLIGASNPYLMNELLEANSMIPANKAVLDELNNNSTLEAIKTPPHSPVHLEALNSSKIGYHPSQSPVDIPDIIPELDLNLMNSTGISTPEVQQPIVVKSMNSAVPSVPSQEETTVIPKISQVPVTLYQEVEDKKVQPIVQTKTNYTYVPVTKKRQNSDSKGVKLERRSSSKSSQKKSSSLKNKSSKTIQKQVKHTFVIETPGINYGKKTTGRKRKCKNEEEILAALPQVPQVPCRPVVSIIPPQKLSKIHARTTEDLDSLPYQCEYCPSAFSRKHDLKRHIKIHIGNTSAYKCQHCGKSYARAEALAKHQATTECQK